jgi:hypothetical protein
MRTGFQRSLKIGKVWETAMESWMERYLKDSGWSVEDTRHVHRDEDGDQFPDYIVYNVKTGVFCFIDAKKRRIYNNTFGFDAKFYRSYKIIARKHNTKVFIGFHDPEHDPANIYILDLDIPHDKIIQYNNAWGSEPSYRWYLDKMAVLPVI